MSNDFGDVYPCFCKTLPRPDFPFLPPSLRRPKSLLGLNENRNFHSNSLNSSRSKKTRRAVQERIQHVAIPSIFGMHHIKHEIVSICDQTSSEADRYYCEEMKRSILKQRLL